MSDVKYTTAWFAGISVYRAFWRAISKKKKKNVSFSHAHISRVQLYNCILNNLKLWTPGGRGGSWIRIKFLAGEVREGLRV